MHLDNQPYLSLVHSVTNQLLEWIGLPMGVTNSPVLASCFSLAFLYFLHMSYPNLFDT